MRGCVFVCVCLCTSPITMTVCYQTHPFVKTNEWQATAKNKEEEKKTQLSVLYYREVYFSSHQWTCDTWFIFSVLEPMEQKRESDEGGGRWTPSHQLKRFTERTSVYRWISDQKKKSNHSILTTPNKWSSKHKPCSHDGSWWDFSSTKLLVTVSEFSCVGRVAGGSPTRKRKKHSSVVLLICMCCYISMALRSNVCMNRS